MQISPSCYVGVFRLAKTFDDIFGGHPAGIRIRIIFPVARNGHAQSGGDEGNFGERNGAKQCAFRTSKFDAPNLGRSLSIGPANQKRGIVESKIQPAIALLQLGNRLSLASVDW